MINEIEQLFTVGVEQYERNQALATRTTPPLPIAGCVVRAEGLEPSRTLRSNGFSYPLRLSPPLLLRPFGVWTIPSP